VIDSRIPIRSRFVANPRPKPYQPSYSIRRASAVLASADGKENRPIAHQPGSSAGYNVLIGQSHPRLACARAAELLAQRLSGPPSQEAFAGAAERQPWCTPCLHSHNWKSRSFVAVPSDLTRMSFLLWGDIFTLPFGGDRVMELKQPTMKDNPALE
jgi:hypothetical protein